jgi:hypothetical protein
MNNLNESIEEITNCCRNINKQMFQKLNLKKKRKFVTQSRTGVQIYEGHDDQLNRPGPMA